MSGPVRLQRAVSVEDCSGVNSTTTLPDSPDGSLLSIASCPENIAVHYFQPRSHRTPTTPVTPARSDLSAASCPENIAANPQIRSHGALTGSIKPLPSVGSPPENSGQKLQPDLHLQDTPDSPVASPLSTASCPENIAANPQLFSQGASASPAQSLPSIASCPENLTVQHIQDHTGPAPHSVSASPLAATNLHSTNRPHPPTSSPPETIHAPVPHQPADQPADPPLQNIPVVSATAPRSVTSFLKISTNTQKPFFQQPQLLTTSTSPTLKIAENRPNQQNQQQQPIAHTPTTAMAVTMCTPLLWLAGLPRPPASHTAFVVPLALGQHQQYRPQPPLNQSWYGPPTLPIPPALLVPPAVPPVLPAVPVAPALPQWHQWHQPPIAHQLSPFRQQLPPLPPHQQHQQHGQHQAYPAYQQQHQHQQPQTHGLSLPPAQQYLPRPAPPQPRPRSHNPERYKVPVWPPFPPFGPAPAPETATAPTAHTTAGWDRLALFYEGQIAHAEQMATATRAVLTAAAEGRFQTVGVQQLAVLAEYLRHRDYCVEMLGEAKGRAEELRGEEEEEEKKGE